MFRSILFVVGIVGCTLMALDARQYQWEVFNHITVQALWLGGFAIFFLRLRAIFALVIGLFNSVLWAFHLGRTHEHPIWADDLNPDAGRRY